MTSVYPGMMLYIIGRAWLIIGDLYRRVLSSYHQNFVANRQRGVLIYKGIKVVDCTWRLLMMGAW